jgi:hypothetical protein
VSSGSPSGEGSRHNLSTSIRPLHLLLVEGTPFVLETCAHASMCAAVSSSIYDSCLLLYCSLLSGNTVLHSVPAYAARCNPCF